MWNEKCICKFAMQIQIWSPEVHHVQQAQPERTHKKAFILCALFLMVSLIIGAQLPKTFLHLMYTDGSGMWTH